MDVDIVLLRTMWKYDLRYVIREEEAKKNRNKGYNLFLKRERYFKEILRNRLQKGRFYESIPVPWVIREFLECAVHAIF